ncbi:RNA polymerase subunit sigma-70 [Longibacter salinarum]|uniref:RNA polymerase subunit sigma-70 n=1 Tax=Longibacter salinarum TaxID=1850348 RepID=A0A2A8CXZ4_9BACT|nr:RNA polymerase sigma factor [Longibacter salinarum]PEN13526.1 RNA polymerase subunit sigma-70 [Longibacter salinarum]
MPDDVSDGTYVQRVRDGDSSAFRPLLERYEGMVYELTYRYASDEDDAADLAQEVFMRAYNRIDDLRNPDRFASWLYGIALNRCRDYAKNIRRQTFPFSRTEAADQDSTPNPLERQDSKLEREEKGEALWRALDTLTPTYSVPFLMKYRDGMTYKAMSKRLDVSVSALKVRVHRARKKLRTVLENEDLDAIRPE